MAVTEKFNFVGTLRGDSKREKAWRTVEISGRDCPKFAAVLRAQAEKADAAGEHSNAIRLRNSARSAERARKVVIRIPMTSDLKDVPEKTSFTAQR